MPKALAGHTDQCLFVWEVCMRQTVDERLEVRVYMSAKMRTVLRVGAVLLTVALVLFVLPHFGLTIDQAVVIAKTLLK
jgi:hypothetical protein